MLEASYVKVSFVERVGNSQDMSFEYGNFSVAQKLTEIRIFFFFHCPNFCVPLEVPWFHLTLILGAVNCCKLIFSCWIVDLGRGCRSLILFLDKLTLGFAKSKNQIIQLNRVIHSELFMFLQLKVMATYMFKKGVSAIFMLKFYNWFTNVDRSNE